MSDISRGVLVGVIVSILLMAVLAEAAGVLNHPTPPPAATLELTLIGPDGKPGTTYGDDLKDVEIPGSAAYPVCMVTGERVKRPPMFTDNLPDAYCQLTRGDGGKWLLSTGGFQECEVSCLKLGGG